jgi:hypothetical protein
MKRNERWQDWAVLILGAWLFFSPLFLGYASAASPAWNAYVVGAAVAILAASALWAPSFGLDEEWGSLALGLWLVAAPLVLGFYSAEPPAAWNQIVVGILIAGDAAWAVAARPLGTRIPHA